MSQHRRPHSRRFRTSPAARRFRLHDIEMLEQRLLLAQDMWTGGGDGKSWQDASNWSTKAVPGSSDDVTIDVATNLTIVYNGTSSIQDVVNNAALEITGGSLTVTSGTSQVGGALTVGGNATLSASGSGTTFTASGTTNIGGANIYASGGAVVAFPTVTALSTPTSYNTTIQASGTSGSNGTGTPSEVNLSHVTSLTGTTDDVIFFNAYSGGEVNLSHLASNPSGRNYFQVSGSGSVLDLSALPAILSNQGNTSLLSVTSGGTVLAPKLTTFTDTDLTIDGTATVPTKQITSYTGGTITVNSGTPDFSGLTSIAGDAVYANGGAVVAFPTATALSTPASYNTTIQASGTSGSNGTGTPSEVDLSHVTSLTGTSDNVIFFNAYSGGEVNLSHLASNPSGRNFFQVSGSGSVLDLSSLPSAISDQDNNSEINVSTGGTLLDPLLTALDRTDLSVDGSATVATAQITSITGSQVFASDGAVIAFPGLTALSTYSGANLSIQASGTSGTGTPSEVHLSHVTSLTGTSDNVYFFNAYSGGELDLSHLASNPSGRNFFQVSGSGSVLDLSSLPSVVSDQDNNSEINVGSGGTLLDPLLTALMVAPT